MLVFCLSSILAAAPGTSQSVWGQDGRSPATMASHNASPSWGLPFDLKLPSDWLQLGPTGSANQPAAPTPPPRQVHRQGETVPGMLAMARLVERQGDLAKAEGMYRGILASNPHHPVALHRLGVVAGQRGNYELSAAVLEQARQQSPRNAELLADLGHTYYQLERPAESEKHLRQALNLNPRDEVARNNLAMVLTVQRRYDEALAEFRKVGTEAEAHASLSFVLRQIGEVDAANQHYETAMSMNRTLRRAVGALVWTQEKPENPPTANVARRPAPRTPAMKPAKSQSLVRHSRRPPPDPAPKPPTTTSIAKSSQPKAPAAKPSAPSREALMPEKAEAAKKPATDNPSTLASRSTGPSAFDITKSKPTSQPHVASSPRNRDKSQLDLSQLGNLWPNYPTTDSQQDSQGAQPKPSTIAAKEDTAPQDKKSTTGEPDVSKSLVTKEVKVLNPKTAKESRSPAVPTMPQRTRQPLATVTRRPAPAAQPEAHGMPSRPTTQMARSSQPPTAVPRSATAKHAFAPVVDASSYKEHFDTATASGVSYRTANIQDGDSQDPQDTWLAAYRTLVQKATQTGQKKADGESPEKPAE
jgi:Flp pilus assembly protein TadD